MNDCKDPLEIRRWMVAQRDFFQAMIDAFDKMNSVDIFEEHALFLRREPARLEESYLNRVANHPFEQPVKEKEENKPPVDDWRFGKWRYGVDGSARKLESEQ